MSPSRLSSRSLSARIARLRGFQMRRDQLDVERSLPLGGCAPDNGRGRNGDCSPPAQGPERLAARGLILHHTKRARRCRDPLPNRMSALISGSLSMGNASARYDLGCSRKAASADSRAGQGLLCLSRGSHEPREHQRFPPLRDTDLAPHASAAEPERPVPVGTDAETGGRLAPSAS